MMKLKDDLVGLGVTVLELGFLRAVIKAIKATNRNELLKFVNPRKVEKELMKYTK